jgi:malonyl-CoA O-methyltransferase
MSASATLSTLDAYEKWASSYPPAPHNPLMNAEQKVMLDLCPDVRGKRVLDLACGSGRYSNELVARGARIVAGLDFSPAMLRRAASCFRVQADMMRMPFFDASFSTIICGLAVGHVGNLSGWLGESARVLEVDGYLVYSDFHPEAARAGMSRSFKDEASNTWQLTHYLHEIADHQAAAARANLAIEAIEELRIGEQFCERFDGCENFYGRWHGLPLLLAIRARKTAPSRVRELRS